MPRAPKINRFSVGTISEPTPTPETGPEEPEPEPDPQPEPQPEPLFESDDDDAFMEELRREIEAKPLPPPTPSPPPSMMLPPPVKRRAARKRALTPLINEAHDSLFSSSPTPILGQEIRELLTKVQQYKTLFPAQLKTFKIKTNPSADDLRNAIAEMDAIVSVGSLEDFITSTLLEVIRAAESVSARTESLDFSGTAAILREDARFNSLCKQCLLKYGTFLRAPPEVQLALIVMCTAAMQITVNRKKKAMGAYLNEPA
jgi:hypothetical protein